MTGRLFLCALVVAATAVVEGAVAAVGQGAIAGPAEISGTVITTADPATPLARVLVTVRSESLKASRTLVSDEQGRFAFRDLPPGTFTIVAARPPYVTMAFGAKRPGRPGTAISLAAGQRVANISIALPRGAAIAGLIRQPGGEAAVGVNVTATASDPNPGSAGSAQAVTDDRGEYRIFGLPPGRYVVTAGVTESPGAVLTQFSDAEMDAIIARLQRRTAGLSASTGAATTQPVSAPGTPPEQNRRRATYGYAPIHYPGTPDPDQAQAVELTEGEERAGIDVGLQFVRTSALDGRITNPAGALPPGTQVTLTRLRQRASASPTTPRMARSVDAAGGFQFTGILPGKYRVSASVRASIAQDRPPSGVLWAFTDVVVGEDDLSGVAMMLQPGLRLSGRLVFEGARAKPKDLTSILLRLIDVNAPATMAPMATGVVDGTFEITGIVPGSYSLTSLLPETGWHLRSVMVAGRDILDVPLEIGGDVRGAVVTLTDQQTELSGTLQTATNSPAPDHFVVVFPRDRTLWRPASRRVQTTRPNTDGRFVFRDLPAGDYLLAALTDVEPSDLGDEAFLEALIAAAVPVSLGNGEKKTQDLRLIGRDASW